MKNKHSGEKRSEEKLPAAAQRSQILIILAIMLPIMVCSVAWAIAIYLIERDKRQAQIELARLGIDAKQ